MDDRILRQIRSKRAKKSPLVASCLFSPIVVPTGRGILNGAKYPLRATNHAEDFRYSTTCNCHVHWTGRGEVVSCH